VLAEYVRRQGDVKVILSYVMLAEEEDVPRLVRARDVPVTAPALPLSLSLSLP